MNHSTRLLKVDAERPSEAALLEAALLLQSGELVAFATETVYGLGADATNDQAVAKIFEAKGRPSINPLIVHVADIADAKRFASIWPERANRVAEHFWPGPLTIVLPKSDAISLRATANGPTVGLRIPATKVARRLIELAQRPIAAPSANRSNRISPTTAQHVFKDLNGGIPLILDSGPTDVGIESAVVDLCHDRARLLRPGSLSLEEMEAVLGESIDEWAHVERDDAELLTSPGQLAVHYAPRTPTFRMESDHAINVTDPLRYGLLQCGTETIVPWPEPVAHYVLEDFESAARNLYASLHELDAARLDLILIVLPPPTAEWRAIRDRLSRASRPWEGFSLAAP